MTKIAAAFFLGLTSLAAIPSVAHGQAAPAARGPAFYNAFRLPTVSGDLIFSLSASDHYIIGNNGTNSSLSSVGVSGSAGFFSKGAIGAYSAVYAGGFTGFGSGASPYFQSMSLSDNFSYKRFGISLSDSISYLPNQATVGLSGVPGQGDLGLTPVGSDGSVGSLSQNATRINNTATASLSTSLTNRTGVEVSGGQTLLRFLGSGGGIESNAYTFSGGGSHQIDSRTSINASVSSSQTSFVGQTISYGSQGATIGLSRVVTKRLSASVGAGPQRIGASSVLGSAPTYTFSASAGLTYNFGRTNASVNFSRSSNAGSGLSYGAETNSLSGSVSRSFFRSVSTSASVAYSSNSSLAAVAISSLNTHNVTASVQASRALARTISAYVSYSAQHQLAQGTANALTPLNGTTQSLAFGITYSPKPIHLGH